ncbi:O-antigen ligase family protein [Mesorhizobium onobrychidis]|uniref:O-antigen ligase family protein n=1 Tax=Mesorhizobium onobrychidis TaxID=2775404 RepID=A0ABY5QU69_9HYPH|nr:O-antigen ligase family protein [Mesorhizobium onobrychidis]UVC14568.1 O-antigen ligase family protein [Mesorhizobium onobrychidis]
MTQRVNFHYDAPPADFDRGGIGRRFEHLRGYVDRRIVFSPAMAFALAICGIYSFSGIVNRIDPEGSLGSLLIRAAIALITAVSFILVPPRFRSTTPYLLPLKIFFILYLFRLVENIYISSMKFSPGPAMLFSVFLVTSVAATFILSSMSRAIRDENLIFSLNILCALFLVGLYLNRDMLFVSADSRMSLDKINPIAMGHTAFAFLIYFIILTERTRKLSFKSMIMCPLLFLVVVWARSRGAYIAGAGALLVYVLLLKGSNRVLAISGAIAVAIVVLASTGTELIDVVADRLEQINSADQSTTLRSLMQEGAWRQFQEDPLFGRYVVEMQLRFYPHNIYLESLMSVGLIGSLPFAAHIILALRSTVGIIRSGKFPLGAVFAAVVFIREAIAGLASGSLWGNAIFWVSSALTISFWYGYQGFLDRSRKLENRAY